MKFETAKKILTKRAENFYGISLEELIEFIDTNPQAESLSVIKAYDAYKHTFSKVVIPVEILLHFVLVQLPGFA